MAKLKLRAVAMTTLAAQLICFSNSSSTSTQHFSVACKLARPPAAKRISKLPQPISLATAQTASSSPTSPSSSSVTQMDAMPSDSRTRMSSSLITWPFASNFFPPGRKTVQHSTRPFDDFTSTVWARMFPSLQVLRCYGLVYPNPEYSTCGVGFHSRVRLFISEDSMLFPHLRVFHGVAGELARSTGNWPKAGSSSCRSRRISHQGATIYFGGQCAIPSFEGIPRCGRGTCAQHRQLDQGGFLKLAIPLKMPAVLRAQNAHHGDLVAALELRAAHAIFPSLERQLAALHFLEAHFAEEIRHIGEGEHGVERVVGRFPDQRLDEPPADAMGLGIFGHGE